MNRGETSREKVQTQGRWSNYILSPRNSFLVYNKSTFSSNPVVEPSHNSPHTLFSPVQTRVRAYKLRSFGRPRSIENVSAKSMFLRGLTDTFIYFQNISYVHVLLQNSSGLLEEYSQQSYPQFIGEIIWI
jgi:hypothetical protein